MRTARQRDDTPPANGADDQLTGMTDHFRHGPVGNLPVWQDLAVAQPAREVAQRVEAALTRLLAELERWNDYQDLIQDTRSLRDLQRMLQDKTEEVRGKR